MRDGLRVVSLLSKDEMNNEKRGEIKKMKKKRGRKRESKRNKPLSSLWFSFLFWYSDKDKKLQGKKEMRLEREWFANRGVSYHFGPDCMLRAILILHGRVYHLHLFSVHINAHIILRNITFTCVNRLTYIHIQINKKFIYIIRESSNNIVTYHYTYLIF